MAKLNNFSIRAPAVKGLNTQGSLGLVDPFWALTAKNCVFDDNDRVAARMGWTKVTTSAATTHDFETIALYEQDKDTRHILVAGNDSNNSDAPTIWTGTTTLTNKIGTLTPAGNDWTFTMLQGKVFGAQQGEALIEWDGGAGNFVTTSGAGTPPDGDFILAHSGRLWGMTADRTTLKWSGLLNGSQWNAGGAGSVDITEHLSDDDFIVGLAPFQGRLVVFCRESIVVFINTQDPGSAGAGLTIKDRIPGIGCISKNSIVNVGTDVLFLDETGLRSLARSLELEATPLREISHNVRDEFLNDVEGASPKSKCKAAYHPSLGFYIITVPSSNEHVEWYVDLRKTNEDGTARMFKWNSIEVNDYVYDRAADTFFIAKSGVVGKYDGYQDNLVSYIMEVKSGWIDEKKAPVLIPKRSKWFVVGGGGYNVTVTWAFNYASDSEFTETFSIPSINVSEWNVAEWGIGEWTGSDTRTYRPPAIEMTGAGHRLQLGWRVAINGNAFAVQSIDVAFASGRTATGADDF